MIVPMLQQTETDHKISQQCNYDGQHDNHGAMLIYSTQFASRDPVATGSDAESNNSSDCSDNGDGSNRCRIASDAHG